MLANKKIISCVERNYPPEGPLRRLGSKIGRPSLRTLQERVWQIDDLPLPLLIATAETGELNYDCVYNYKI